jgi:hypothetical protein
MKAYVKWLVVFVLLFAVAVPMLLKRPDGRPIMQVSDWLPAAGNLNQLVDQLKAVGAPLLGEQLQQRIDPVSVNSDAGSDRPVLSSEQLAASPALLSAASGKMFKWQDANGKWHFSSEKPQEQRDVSVEDLPEVKNVMVAPVTRGDNSSTISLPGFGEAGDLLKKVQQMTEDRNDE